MLVTGVKTYGGGWSATQATVVSGLQAPTQMNFPALPGLEPSLIAT